VAAARLLAVVVVVVLLVVVVVVGVVVVLLLVLLLVVVVVVGVVVVKRSVKYFMPQSWLEKASNVHQTKIFASPLHYPQPRIETELLLFSGTTLLPEARKAMMCSSYTTMGKRSLHTL
jgi:hypothetical protein